MRTHRIAFVAVAVFTLLARVAAAQQTYTSVGGPWWFKLSGKDKGALFVQLSEPNASMLTITDVALSERPSFGFSRSLAAFFQLAADQALAIDAKGNITGVLELSDVGTTDPVGMLTIVKGKSNKKFTKLSLSATIEGVAGAPLVVKLAGVRPPAGFPVLTGHTSAASVKGKGVKSSALDLAVTSDADLGFPAYSWIGSGVVDIDKAPVDSDFAGHLMLDPKFNAQGLLDSSSDFGTGPLSGKLVAAGKTETVPKLSLTAEADRKLSLKAKLTDPTEPVLQVTPLSKDFGPIHLNETRTQFFQVSNVGVGTLSGMVTFLDGSDADFVLPGATTYGPLAPGDPPVNIPITFNPGVAGDKSASLRFGVDTFVGAKVVMVTGVAGLAVVGVDMNPIHFADITAGMSETLIVKVTNNGDAHMNGKATLTGSSTFGLMSPPATLPVSSISYSLDPAQEKDITIRFLPTAVTGFSGTLNLTGGGGLTVPISGTGK
jgi:hypothetical protein